MIFPKTFFTGVGLFSVKRLQVGADLLLIITSTNYELFRGINIDDFEPLTRIGAGPVAVCCLLQPSG